MFPAVTTDGGASSSVSAAVLELREGSAGRIRQGLTFWGERFVLHTEIHYVCRGSLGKKKKQWKLMHKEVSMQCLAALMGVGADRLSPHGSGGGKVDRRFRCFGLVPWQNVFSVQFVI